MRSMPPWPLVFVALAILAPHGAGALAQDGDEIVIHDAADPVPKQETKFESGPTDLTTGVNVGNILNAHYFPALDLYRKMNFRNAKMELDYFIERPEYTRNNPRQREFFSTAHYLRGLIFLEHATGLGRLSRAKNDFEECLRWDPGFHSAYLGLARVWKEVGDEKSARAVLEHLIGLDPDEVILRQARELLGQDPDGTGAPEGESREVSSHD